MYQMTLKDTQTCSRACPSRAPSDTTRSAAIETARAGQATALPVMEIHGDMQRWAELGRGIARTEAKRALEEKDEGGGVRRYDTGR